MYRTFLILSDLGPNTNPPRVRMSLPLLRLGDNLALSFTLERVNNGRREVLEVEGVYHVIAITLEGSAESFRQSLSVAATGIVPAWRAVKRAIPRKLAPARSPRTSV